MPLSEESDPEWGQMSFRVAPFLSFPLVFLKFLLLHMGMLSDAHRDRPSVRYVGSEVRKKYFSIIGKAL